MADILQILHRKEMADSRQNRRHKGTVGIRQSLHHKGRADSHQPLRHKGIEEMAIFSDLSLERLGLSDKEMADILQILLQILLQTLLQTLRHTAEVSSLCLDCHKNQAA